MHLLRDDVVAVCDNFVRGHIEEAVELYCPVPFLLYDWVVLYDHGVAERKGDELNVQARCVVHNC